MKLAIFDFDGTLFLKQTIPFFIKQWQDLGYSKSKLFIVKNRIIFLYLKYKLHLLPKEDFRTTVIELFPYLFMGMNKEEINDYFEKAANEAHRYFNQDVVREITRAKDNGFYTVILSGCYRMFLEVIATDLGIDSVVGTELFFSKTNELDYEKKLNHINGYLKANTIKKKFNDKDIDWQNSYAFADSIADLELLNLVGNAVAVRPDKKLLSYANKHNWRII